MSAFAFVVAPEADTTHDVINVSYPDFVRDVKVGDHVLFDDGAIDMLVTAKDEQALHVTVQNDGTLGSHKSVNVPGGHIDLPALTERDKENILLAIEEDIDFIAHSFVRSAADVKAVQDILDAHGSDIKIISKIENQEGVDNIDEIIDASYGVMIARGDLGIEVPIERIPGIQRQIIHKCVVKKKPVIVATQMLHTMINNPRPTRAEVTDIANAIYYRTDALMPEWRNGFGKISPRSGANDGRHRRTGGTGQDARARPRPDDRYHRPTRVLGSRCCGIYAPTRGEGYSH